jgi:Ca-activated chloride channel family protein
MNDGGFSMRWRIGLLVAVIVIGALPGGIAAQRGRAELNDGNRLYEEGRFGEAHERYLEALRDAPDLSLALFNDGNALYQSEEYARALDAYLGAIESGGPALSALAWYNLGNALYRQQKFQESAEAFKQALRIEPDQIDYKHNLELALEQQIQQPEQDPESEDRDESEQNEDQSQDQENQEQEQDQDPDPDENQNQDSQPEEPQDEDPPEPAPGEMTEEEAERLLQGVQEDPGEVNRRRAPLRGRRPAKPW